MLALPTLLLGMLSFALQVSERRVNPRLDAYANCLWMIAAGMRGAGYEGFAPQTPLGRAAAAAAFGWGVMLAALTVRT